MRVISKCREIGILWAKKTAEKEANRACPYISYQAKLPKSVKELKKHN